MLKDASRSVWILLHLGDDAAGKDEVVIKLVETDCDKVVLIFWGISVYSVVPGRLVVHSDEDIILPVFAFIPVQVLSANTLSCCDG